MLTLTKPFKTLSVFALLAMTPGVATAAPPDCVAEPTHKKCGGVTEEPPAPTGSWLHSDVGTVHGTMYMGQPLTGIGSHMITVDNFSGVSISGNLGTNRTSGSHGDWTYLQSQLVAPGASYNSLNHSLSDDTALGITHHYNAGANLNVVNLSFGLFDPAGTDVDGMVLNPEGVLVSYSLGNPLWDSLKTEARAGTAVFVKAAGNTNGGTVDGTIRMRLGGIRPERAQDVLNLSLIGAPGAIFVGALDGHGTVDEKASIASYSTIAGSNQAVQNMFLVVGVEDGLTGLAGTSFAAPIVTGYAAIIGQKFALDGTTPAAALVVDQLLDTARRDTVLNYDASVHGRGEASLINALSPITIQ